jgi:hypothetical protein
MLKRGLLMILELASFYKVILHLQFASERAETEKIEILILLESDKKQRG